MFLSSAISDCKDNTLIHWLVNLNAKIVKNERNAK